MHLFSTLLCAGVLVVADFEVLHPFSLPVNGRSDAIPSDRMERLSPPTVVDHFGCIVSLCLSPFTRFLERRFGWTADVVPAPVVMFGCLTGALVGRQAFYTTKNRHQTIQPAKTATSASRRTHSGMSEVDELLVALTCRFALDVFTIIQQDHPTAAQDAALIDLELEELG